MTIVSDKESPSVNRKTGQIWRGDDLETLVQMNKQWKEITSQAFSFCVPKDTVPAKAFEVNQFKRKRVEILVFDRPYGFKELLRAGGQCIF